MATDQGLSAGGEVSSCLVLSLLFSIRRGAQREWFGTRGCGKYPDETRSKTLAASLLGHSPETQWQVTQQGVEEEVCDIV